MKTKTMTVVQAFKLFRMLKAKQSKRSQWLGPSPVYSSRIDDLKRNAELCLERNKMTQGLTQTEYGMLTAILKG